MITIEKPRCFRCKKYFVLAVSALTMTSIAITAVLVAIVNEDEFNTNAKAWEEKFNILPKDESQIRKTGIIILVVVFGILIGVNVFGFIGTLRESFCMTTVYVCQGLLFTIWQLVEVIFHGMSFVGLCWSAVSTLISLFFLRDLYIIRLKKREMKKRQQSEQMDHFDLEVMRNFD